MGRLPGEVLTVVGLPGAGGLPGGRALHPRWSEHHEPTAEQFMTAEVVILRHSSDGSFDPDTGRTTYPEPVKVWRGWARIQRIQSEEAKQIGDRQVIVRSATVSIPVSASEMQIGDEVKVRCYRDPDSGDPYLLDRPLWVHDVRPGSMLWQRDLVVRDAPPTTR